MQDAVPMSLGQEFQAFAVLLDEEVERLIHNAALLLEVNLGATAIGTGLNTPPGYQEAAVRHLLLNPAFRPAVHCIGVRSGSRPTDSSLPWLKTDLSWISSKRIGPLLK